MWLSSSSSSLLLFSVVFFFAVAQSITQSHQCTDKHGHKKDVQHGLSSLFERVMGFPFKIEGLHS